jgi:hypothetical protein
MVALTGYNSFEEKWDNLVDINTIIKKVRSRIFGLYEGEDKCHYCIMITLADYYRYISGGWIKVNDYSLLRHKG